MKRTLLMLVSIALGALIGFEAYVYLAPRPRSQPRLVSRSLPRGDPPSSAPAFALTDLQGKQRTLSGLRGQLVLVNFWAPWCLPCREEAPLLERTQKHYASQGLRILGPAVDDAAPVRAFVRKHGITYPVFANRQAAIRLSKAYGDDVGALPYTVLVGRHGHILHSQAGRLSAQTLRQWLRQALGKSADS